MQSGRLEIMLRNLVIAGLTALLLGSLASTADAARNGAAGKKSEQVHHTPTGAADGEMERPVRPVTTAKKKIIKSPVRTGAPRRAVRRFRAAAVNQSLLRQSWTVADLNPMPALLDLDDTAKNLRRATAEIVKMMTR